MPFIKDRTFHPRNAPDHRLELPEHNSVDIMILFIADKPSRRHPIPDGWKLLKRNRHGSTFHKRSEPVIVRNGHAACIMAISDALDIEPIVEKKGKRK